MKSKRPLATLAVASLVLVFVLVGLAVLHAKIVVWLLAIALFLMSATVATRGWVRWGFVTLASLVLMLSAFEGAGLYIDSLVVFDRDKGFDTPRAVVGWGPAHPGVYRDKKSVDGHALFDVTYTIDQDLFRVVASGKAGPAVSFFGDSYIFGLGLNDADTLPQRFADLEGRALPVYNLAIPSYSPAQVLSTMTAGVADRILKQSELLVEFVAPWQAQEAACKMDWDENAPRYEIVDRVPHAVGTCRLSGANKLLERFHFYKTFIKPRLRISEDSDFARWVAIIKETIRLSHDKYHVPIIIYYFSDPQSFSGTTWTDERIRSQLQAAGASILAYNIHNEDRAPYAIEGDPHPTGIANAIHADRLAAFVERSFPDLAVSKALRRHADALER